MFAPRQLIMKLNLIAVTVFLYSLLAAAMIALSEVAEYWETFALMRP